MSYGLTYRDTQKKNLKEKEEGKKKKKPFNPGFDDTLCAAGKNTQSSP